MQKRICLLTGASGTLGNAFCRAHAADYGIAAVYRTLLPEVTSEKQRFVDPLAVAGAVRETGAEVFAIRADLSNDCELERVVELTLARFGGIDLLVHAAVYSVWANMDADRLLESFDHQFRINVRVPFMLTNLIGRRFWRARDRENSQRNRNVVHVSSMAGVKVYPGVGQSVYAASKAALNHLVLHMASEFRTSGIRINAVAPNSFPQIVSVEDVVRTIRRLDQGTMNGKILVVDAPKAQSAD